MIEKARELNESLEARIQREQALHGSWQHSATGICFEDMKFAKPNKILGGRKQMLPLDHQTQALQNQNGLYLRVGNNGEQAI